MAITLLWILNTDRVPARWRNRPAANVVMGVIALLFVWLAVTQVQNAVEKVLG